MTIRINRAPVLTLWATVVAEQLDHDRALALTLGRAIAGRAAFAKAKSLGIAEKSRAGLAERSQRDQAETLDFMGKRLPVAQTPDGTRAVDADGKPINPASVDKYIASKFGASLEEITAAMVALAKSMTPAELRARAFGLYEIFRPAVAVGTQGRGTSGELDVEKIRTASNAATLQFQGSSTALRRT